MIKSIENFLNEMREKFSQIAGVPKPVFDNAPSMLDMTKEEIEKRDDWNLYVFSNEI